MADGVQIEARGLSEALKKLTQIGVRMSDLTPPMKSIGTEIERRTIDGFAESKSSFGEPFAPLAPSTIAHRIGKLKSANRRTKAGALTKGAHRIREKLSAPGGLRPLIDTGRAKASLHWVAGRFEVVVSVIAYLLFHMTGGQRGGKLGRPPMRNPTPIIHKGSGGFDFLGDSGGSKWSLDPSMNIYAKREIENHVLDRKAG